MLDKLKLNPNNPRTIKKDDFARLKQSIKDFPEMLKLRPIVYSKDNVIMGGNMRFRAIEELAKEGFEVKDEYFKSADDLTEEQLREFVIKDNIQNGMWDDEMLANEWSDLPLDEWGINTGGWKSDEVVEDEAPEVDETSEPISKLGEVYQLGRHRLMCGDSTKIEDVEKLMNGQKADMVFTDPPYGMDLDTDWSSIKGSDKAFAKVKGGKYDRVIGDSEDYDPAHIFEMFGYVKEIFLFGADYYAERLYDKNKGSWLVWDKRKPSQENAIGSEFELIWSKNKHKRRVLRHDWFGFLSSENTKDARNRVHPTQKPITLLVDVMKQWGKANDIVLDLFGGSGSTLIACEQLDRTCYMMELDPLYCDVVRRRYAKFIGKEGEWETTAPLISR